MSYFVFIFLVSSLLFIQVQGCSHHPGHQLKKRRVPEYNMDNKYVQYLLPELPLWADFSTAGNCRKSSSVKYLDLEKLMKSYNLSYRQGVQFQYSFNTEYRNLLKKNNLKFLRFKEEEKLFYEISDKIQANIYTYRNPKFNTIHLVWIDSTLSDKIKQKRLIKLMNSSEMDAGYPVFVSLCLGRRELKQYLKKLHLIKRNIRLIPKELFSPFNKKGERAFRIGLNFTELIGHDKKLVFYMEKRQRIKEFQGSFKVKKY